MIASLSRSDLATWIRVKESDIELWLKKVEEMDAELKPLQAKAENAAAEARDEDARIDELIHGAATLPAAIR